MKLIAAVLSFWCTLDLFDSLFGNLIILAVTRLCIELKMHLFHYVHKFRLNHCFHKNLIQIPPYTHLCLPQEVQLYSNINRCYACVGVSAMYIYLKYIYIHVHVLYAHVWCWLIVFPSCGLFDNFTWIFLECTCCSRALCRYLWPICSVFSFWVGSSYMRYKHEIRVLQGVHTSLWYVVEMFML